MTSNNLQNCNQTIEDVNCLTKIQRITMTFVQPAKNNNYNCNYVEYLKLITIHLRGSLNK